MDAVPKQLRRWFRRRAVRAKASLPLRVTEIRWDKSPAETRQRERKHAAAALPPTPTTAVVLPGRIGEEAFPRRIEAATFGRSRVFNFETDSR